MLLTWRLITEFELNSIQRLHQSIYVNWRKNILRCYYAVVWVFLFYFFLALFLTCCNFFTCAPFRFFPLFLCYNVPALLEIELLVSSHLDDLLDSSGRTTYPLVSVPVKHMKSGTTRWGTGHYRRVSFHQKISSKERV